MTKLLEYEFWKVQNSSYINLFDNNLAKGDRLKKREFFSENILRTSNRPIKWLDVGTGEGSKVLETIQCIQRDSPEIRIDLTVLEPSPFIIDYLKENFKNISNVNLSVINDKFSKELLIHNSYDCVTFFHAMYYIANEKNDFSELLDLIRLSLKQDGKCIIQAVDENGDFQMLQLLGKDGEPAYSYWSQGNHLCSLLEEKSIPFRKNEFPTHFDATDFIQQITLVNDVEQRFLRLYSFIMQAEDVNPTEDERGKFIEKIKKIAIKIENRYYLNFNDIVIVFGK